jgi:hypothetical protein
MWCISLFSTIFSSFPPPLVSSTSPTFGYMFCIYFYVHIILLVFTFHERKRVAFGFLNLAYLKWCSPVPSIYLQMTKFHSSLWLNKIPLSDLWGAPKP